MANEYKQSLEFTLHELNAGMQIAKEDIKTKIKENGPYFIKGALSSIFSLLPFQKRHEFPSENFSKLKTIYYTNCFGEMNTQNNLSASIGFLSALGVYYGIGSNYASTSELLGVQALILLPFSIQYVSNSQPKTIQR